MMVDIQRGVIVGMESENSGEGEYCRKNEDRAGEVTEDTRLRSLFRDG